MNLINSIDLVGIGIFRNESLGYFEIHFPVAGTRFRHGGELRQFHPQSRSLG